jgi:hypothetical protein
VRSITWRWTGDFTAEVEATYQHAHEIEDGRPPRDLKRMLDSSVKVRAGKDGKRYLIIPFRHAAPGSTTGRLMPPDVHKMAKAMGASRVRGQATRLSGTGAMDIKTQKHLTVNQSVYRWSDRLPAGLAPKLKPYHATDPFDSMVRFDTSSGGNKRSSYLTFRVMSEKSTGWIVPAQPGMNIAKGVVESMQPKAEQAFGSAIEREIG